ncbi:uncharacterized protein LOC116806043 [Drosophila grimshawi]|uniref:uncharacterized protein LOC116806043 n=1 Tax=Drosophila grimshawi TaxID=7222 RepID=UPI000C86F904|nr:uncharacterized protein LOC116806043 [Drosophila grimshawi]
MRLSIYKVWSPLQKDANGGGYQYNPPPDNSYLPPDNSYLPPATSPPAPVYGPPPLPYNSQPPVFYRPSYPTPYHTHDSFLDKLKSKISLLTIGKLILKLLIFKKIVKFIGIICLLLVLPKLKNMFHDSMPMEEDVMSSKIVQTDQDQLQKQINEVYEFIMNSIQYLDEEST